MCNIRFRVVAFLMLLASTLTHVANARPVLRLASDDWCPYICASDGHIKSGYLVDVTREAMDSVGYTVVPVLKPLSRAMFDTINGRGEGVYAPPSDERLLISGPIATSRACFYTLKGSAWKYKGISSLAAIQLGVVADYGYDDGAMDAYIAAHQSDAKRLSFARGENGARDNVRKLALGAAPVILEHAAVMTHMRSTLPKGLELQQAGCLEKELALTVGFSRSNPRSPEWVCALELGVKTLKSSARWQELEQRYGLPRSHSASQSTKGKTASAPAVAGPSDATERIKECSLAH